MVLSFRPHVWILVLSLARIPARAQYIVCWLKIWKVKDKKFNVQRTWYGLWKSNIKKGLQGCLRSYFILELCKWLRTCKLDRAYLHYEFKIGGLFLRTVLNLCMWIGWVELFYIFYNLHMVGFFLVTETQSFDNHAKNLVFTENFG